LLTHKYFPNHRRDLRPSSGLNPCSSRVRCSRLLATVSHWVLSASRFYSLFGQHAPVSDHPQGKEVFYIMFKWNFLYSVWTRSLSSCDCASMGKVCLSLLCTLPSGI